MDMDVQNARRITVQSMCRHRQISRRLRWVLRGMCDICDVDDVCLIILKATVKTIDHIERRLKKATSYKTNRKHHESHPRLVERQFRLLRYLGYGKVAEVYKIRTEMAQIEVVSRVRKRRRRR